MLILSEKDKEPNQFSYLVVSLLDHVLLNTSTLQDLIVLLMGKVYIQQEKIWGKP
jgi:hypothetical protein